jgi:hypothetical protein
VNSTYSAGVYEQTEQGWRLVVWSRHHSEKAAQRAASQYRKRLAASPGSAGGLRSWSSWWRLDGATEHEICA